MQIAHIVKYMSTTLKRSDFMYIGRTNKFYVNRYCRHDRVTGSCFLYSVHWPNGENARFFLDMGMKQGEDNIGSFNTYFPFNTEKIDFGIITHNHLDHVGLLPVLVQQKYENPIFMSYPTHNLLDISLYDSVSIENKDSKETISDIDTVRKTLSLTVGCRYKSQIKPVKNIVFEFLLNGHIVGATSVVIKISYPGEEDIVIVHSGDYKDKNSFFNVEIPPSYVRNLKISNMVVESTYGDVDSTDDMFKPVLEQNTATAIKEGKTVLFPTFAQGRHQEILYRIKMWKKKGIIPERTLVVVDGRTSQEYNARYMYNELGIKKIMRNFMPKDTYPIPRSNYRRVYRREVVEDPQPKIIVAPGGMGTYGPITFYIQNLVSRDDVLLHALGYCSPDSTMHRLLDTPTGGVVHYSGNDYIKRCQVEKTAEMSSHPTRDVMLKFVQYFPNVKSISINHGEQEVQKSNREYYLENMDIYEDQVLTADSDTAIRIESDGITRTFSSSFKPIL